MSLKQPKLNLSEDLIIDLDDFEDLEEDEATKKKMTLEEYEKHFIFQIERGCPICRSDVRGNDHFKYFCKTCNILFDKHEIVKKDFGKHGDEKVKLRVIPLTDEQKATLQNKKQAMIERIQKAFGEEVEEPPEETEPIEEEPEENEPEEPEIESEEQEPKTPTGIDSSMLDAISALGKPKIEEAEFEEVEPKETEPEETEPEETEPDKPEETYEVEEESKIIASKESDKLHKGDCHFIKKIHPENRIYFDSLKLGEKEGYEPCVCLRRLIAKQKAESQQ
ncbi:hypothetical protein ACFL0V_02990 [Nanoarchaeota archaeon]